MSHRLVRLVALLGALGPALPAAAQVTLDPIAPPTLIQLCGDVSLQGSGITPGSLLGVFVATASGPVNVTPSGVAPTSTTASTWSGTLPCPWPGDGYLLGSGFASLRLIRSDQGFDESNAVGVPIVGSDAPGVDTPAITGIDGTFLDDTSWDPSYAVSSVARVLVQGSQVTLDGFAFGGAPLVNLFTAAGNCGPITPDASAADSVQITVPLSCPTGPGSLQVVDTSSFRASNAVAVQIGAAIGISGVAVVGGTVTVGGSGLSSLTVVNLFGTSQGSGLVTNFGGLTPEGAPVLPIELLDDTQLSFTLPADIQSGPAFVEVLNPPFIPFTSSGVDLDGSFTIPSLTYTVAITAPADGTTVTDREVTVTGQVEPGLAGLAVEVNGVPTTTAAGGSFAVPGYPLVDGANALTARVLTGGVVAAEDAVSVTWERPAEAAADVTPVAGGTLVVDDPSSPIAGAGLEVPPGAATRPFRAYVLHDAEHVPALPYGEVAVGPAVEVGALGESFAAPVRIQVPFDPTSLPAGVSAGDIRVRALSEAGWVELTVAAATATTVEVEVSALDHALLLAAVELPLAPGMVRVASDPAYATIYLDGVDTGLRTPATLEGVAAGTHALKLYLAGFNETFVDIVVPAEGVSVTASLGSPVAPVPVVTLDASLFDGLVVADSLLDIVATVTHDGAPLASGVAVIALNGRDTLEQVGPGGSISGAVSLLPGPNQLEVRVTGPNGSTGVSERIEVTLVETVAFQVGGSGGSDVTITLSWNTNETDLDMHVFDPDGHHAWYGNQTGIPGGAIDRDDVDGFGPERFTLPSAPAGTYRVAVDAYSLTVFGGCCGPERVAAKRGGEARPPRPAGGGTLVPTTGALSILVDQRNEFSEGYLFTAEDFNATGGSPIGANPAAFWDAHEFDVGELRITRVEPSTTSHPDDAIFTTAAGESQIHVAIEAPESVLDGEIELEVEEVVEPFTVSTDGLTGREIDFDADHQPLAGLTSPRLSHRLEYRIRAFTRDDQGAVDLQSDPVRLRQDVRSQIRQEYVDKRAFASGFVRVTPARASIVDAGGFPGGTFFTFGELAAFSDFAGLAVIDRSVVIADAVRAAWGKPLRVTSGWRNPRRNDSLSASALNSFHQTGDAVDLNPSLSAASWPSAPDWTEDVAACAGNMAITSYARAQQVLTCVARRALDLTVYDTLFHANHLHLERDPNGPPDS